MKKQRKAPNYLSKAAQDWLHQLEADYDLEDHHWKLAVLAAQSLDEGEKARKELEKHSGLTYLDRFDQPRERPSGARPSIRDRANVRPSA